MAGSLVRALVVCCGVAVVSGAGWGQRVAADVARPRLVSAVVTVDASSVPLSQLLETISRQAKLDPVYSSVVAGRAERVTLHVREMPVEEAFAEALRGTGVVAVIASGRVMFVRERDGSAVAQGTITGKVVDAKTKQGVRGATVTVDDAVKGVVASEDGAFRIVNVAVGTHTVRVRMLGYVKATKATTVVEGQAAVVEFVLAPSVNALDQVVVTGTVIPTEVRAIPNDITVITAKEIDQRGITRIDQLFRGDVPGVYARNLGTDISNPGKTSMSARGSTTLGDAFQQPMKTYVDGVELADPSYLGMVDPKSIERIEIITGPQASTIYGSNAINGVMQVFTKRGTTARPQVTVALQSGLIENNLSSALTPVHDYSAQASAVDGHISYNVGGSWAHSGSWTPAERVTALGGFGGARLQRGAVTVDVSMTRSTAGNNNDGSPLPIIVNLQNEGVIYASTSFGGGLPTKIKYTTWAQQVSLSLGYAPLPWWSQQLVVGTSMSQSETDQGGQRNNSPKDTLGLYDRSENVKQTLAYNTTFQIPVTRRASLQVTAGADGWSALDYEGSSSKAVALTGQLVDGCQSNGVSCTSLYRTPSHNSGVFLQSRLGFVEKFFLTYGVRAEWNPQYGALATPNIVPQYGISYVEDIGAVTAKVHAIYGHSTRPPTAGLAVGKTSLHDAPYLLPYYGNFYYFLPNPELLPEQQKGYEVGLDLYIGSRSWLKMTRYNQTVGDLISYIQGKDSVRSLLPANALGLTSDPKWTDGYSYYYQNQDLNVGSVRNEGWTLEGAVNRGPFTLTGTYSWTKSRIIGISQKYRMYDPFDIVAGQQMSDLPEHTYAFGVQYARGGTSVQLNVTGQTMNYRGSSYPNVYKGYISVYRDQAYSVPRLTYPSNYWTPFPGYAMGDLNATHKSLRTRINGLLQIKNVGNHYESDGSFGAAVAGRQSKAGVRIKF